MFQAIKIERTDCNPFAPQPRSGYGLLQTVLQYHLSGSFWLVDSLFHFLVELFMLDGHACQVAHPLDCASYSVVHSGIPGAKDGYQASILSPLRDEWRGQAKFLGGY